MKKILALALALVMVFALCGVAAADFAPDGPVTMIVAYKAGSGTDNTARVLAKFRDLDFWTRESDRCLSCGACTYFCPSCYCFNITDEGTGVGKPGRRIRSWDNCMSALFTQEASGYNPRPTKATHMRQRVTHKFSTYPENWGAFSCMGCCRCISNCPARIDIRQIVLDAIAEEPAESSK